MALPTQKTPPCDSMTHLSVLIYGASKIGKSTLCSNAENALFLATEAGLNSLDVFQVPVLTWQDMLNACTEIGKGDHQFKTIVVDTVDNMYKMCADAICRKNNIQHESDMGFGKGFSLVNNEFQRVLTKLSLMPYGLYLISHAQDKEMDTPTGKRIKTIPTLPGKAREIVLGMVDIILYCDIEMVPGTDGKKVERRVMRTKPSSLYEAGDRTKRLPETIDLEFTAFVNAYQMGGGATMSQEEIATAREITGVKTNSGPVRPTQAPAVTAQKAPAPTVLSDLPEPWVNAMVDLAAVTQGMPDKTRNKLVSHWEAEGPEALPGLLEEIATMRSVLEPKTVGAVLAQLPPPPKPEISQATDTFVDSVQPDTDEANGGISVDQYSALNTMIGAFGINRDALRAYAAKTEKLLPSSGGRPTLARFKTDEFAKLRDRLNNKAIAGGSETWSQRTVRIINSTPTTTYQPVSAAS